MGDKWHAVIFRGLIKTSKIIRFDNFGKVTFLCTPFKVSYKLQNILYLYENITFWHTQCSWKFISVDISIFTYCFK